MCRSLNFRPVQELSDRGCPPRGGRRLSQVWSRMSAARMASGLGMARVATSLTRTGLWAHKTATTRVVSSAAGLMGVRGLAGGALSARAHSPPSPCRSSSVLRPGSVAWGGHACPMMWRRGDFMRSSPSRGMCEEAEEKEEVCSSPPHPPLFPLIPVLPALRAAVH